MTLTTTLKGLTAALTMALPLSSQAFMLSNGSITITMESWEQFIPGYTVANGTTTVLPGTKTGFYNDGKEDLRGIVNVLGTSQNGASNSYENISQTLAKSLGGESITGILYGFDASYQTGSTLTTGAQFGFTGGTLDLYLDNPANESVAGGPASFGGGSSTYSTISDGTLLLRLAFTLGNDTLSLFGPNTGATLYGTDKAIPTSVAGTYYIQGSSSGFLNVDTSVGTLAAQFDTNSIPIGPTGTTPAGFADFSFSNNFGSECINATTGAHVDGCGNPQFAQVGFDGLVPNGKGLWNTQDQGPAIGARIPEPNVLALAGISMLGLGFSRRKGRNKV